MLKVLIFIVLNSWFYVSANVVNIAISSAPNNLSPFFSTDGNSQNIGRLLHLSLIDFGRNMQFKCIACESFSENIEKDGRHKISFKLRKDLKFWDGTPLTAKDIKQSWEFFTDEKDIKSIFRFAFKKIVEIRELNLHEVALYFKEFNLENFSNLALFKIIKLKNGKYDVKNIIGAGPYRLASTNDFEIVLESEKRPTLKFKVVKDETTLALKMMNQEIDLSLSNISPRKLNWLRKNGKDLEIWEKEGTNYVYMGVNHRNEHLKDRKVRKAISHLIPREKLIQYKLKNTAKISRGMFSSAFKDYFQDFSFDKFSPKLAKKLLEEAGYKLSKDGFYYRDGRRLKLRMPISSNKALVEMATTIKESFVSSGIDVDMSIFEWGTFMNYMKTGRYDIVMARWMGFTGPDMLKYVFYSGNTPPKGGNRGYFNNTIFDALIDKATPETDKQKRNSYYLEAAKVANSEYSYINLWHPNIIWLARNCLKKLDLFANGSFLSLLDLEGDCGK